MTLRDMIAAKLADALDERSTVQTEADEIVAGVEARNETELTEDEQAKFDELRSKFGPIDESIEALEARLAEIDADEARRKTADEARARLGVGTAGAPAGAAGAVQVRSEPRIYEEGNGRSFAADFIMARRKGDTSAQARLARHETEMRADGETLEQRAVGTAAFGGLIPPQYLTDLYAENVRAGRPFLNSLRSLPLPSTGMSFVVPRGTTGTTVAEQASQGDSVSETDFDETDLTIGVDTYAGQQTMSYQSLERGQGNDTLIFADLAADYAAKQDSGAITAALGTSGINAVTYTDASPTVIELWPKLADAIGKINATRFMPATAIVMHPRRWAWITAAVGTDGRPLFGGPAPQNPVGVGDAAGYGQVVGELQGLPVITDANMPINLGSGTDEDRIMVYRAMDLLNWENGTEPKELQAQETTLAGKLQALLVSYGYSAFTAGRYPKAVAVISGTGLVTPTL